MGNQVNVASNILTTALIANRPVSTEHLESTNCGIGDTLFANCIKKPDIRERVSHGFVNNSNTIDIRTNLAQWATTYNVSQRCFNSLLEILNSSFTTLPKDSRTLLKTDYSVSKNIIKMGEGTYYHFGIAHNIEILLSRNISLCTNDSVQNLKLQINIDGLPLTKSSKSQFWPILGYLEEFHLTQPFIIGIYHGYCKPPTTNIFLRPFVDELKILMDNHLFYKNKEYEITLSKIICDAPAKAFILGIKSHNAYYGCTKCNVEGNYLYNRMSFAELNSSRRTDVEFRNGAYEIQDFYLVNTPLTDLSIDIISTITLDYMHLVCLGVTKKLLMFWIKGDRSVRLSDHNIKQISNMLVEFRSSIPKEFSRLPRSLEELDRWKATEFRQFLLYSGPVILKMYLPKRYYMNFLCLHCAIRILATEKLCLKYNNYANQLIIYFIKDFEDIYGVEFINHNVHNLSHLAEEVSKFGALDNFSAFKYENFMHTIKRKVKTSNHPLSQIIKRMQEFEKYNNCFTTENFGVLNQEIDVTERNRYFVTKNKEIIKVKSKVNLSPTNSTLLAVKLKSWSPYFNIPCNSTKFNCVKGDIFSDDIYQYNIEDLAAKCIRFRDYYISTIHKF